MQIALTAEQEDLRQTVRTIAERCGAVSSTGSREEIEPSRADRLLEEFGVGSVLEPRSERWTGCVEAAVITMELSRRLVPGAGLGRAFLAGPLLRGLGCSGPRSTIVLPTSMVDAVLGPDDRRGLAWDGDGAEEGHAVRSAPDRIDVLRVGLPDGDGHAFDLTRATHEVELADAEVVTSVAVADLPPGLLERWRAWTYTAVAADIVGLMDGALEITNAYAKGRHQFGRSIASFQAVQHLLADQYVALRGARVAVYHAAWALQELSAAEALQAAHVAKAHTSAAAVPAAEAMVQIHGGIGFTWEHGAHLYLRRAHLDRATLGTEAVHYAAYLRTLAPAS